VNARSRIVGVWVILNMYAELEDNASTTSVRETAVLVSDADFAWRLLPALLVSNENGLSGLYPRPQFRSQQT